MESFGGSFECRSLVYKQVHSVGRVGVTSFHWALGYEQGGKNLQFTRDLRVSEPSDATKGNVAKVFQILQSASLVYDY